MVSHTHLHGAAQLLPVWVQLAMAKANKRKSNIFFMVTKIQKPRQIFSTSGADNLSCDKLDLYVRPITGDISFNAALPGY